MLASLSGLDGTAILIGEDAHWADQASLELLRFLGRRISGLRLLFIVTYRDDEVGPTHPLRLSLGDLASAPSVHRIALPPLSEGAVATLAAGSAHDPAELYRLTDGNPFFVTEILAGASAGAFRHPSATPCWPARRASRRKRARRSTWPPCSGKHSHSNC